MTPEEIQYRRLHPQPGLVGVRSLIDELEFEPAEPAEPAEVSDRPYVVVNFVSSVDGRATFEGKSGALGDDGDRALFHGLRERVDAVLAGTVTMGTENYGRILGKAERRDRRAAAGREAEPLACMITRSGEIPLEIPLFDEPEARVVIFAATDLQLGGVAAQVRIVRLDPAELTLTTVMRELRGRFGVRTLLCEGGPTLFGALLRERLADELFLTLSPNVGGGGRGPTVTSGPELPALQPLSLAWVLERRDSLYLRYRIRHETDAS